MTAAALLVVAGALIDGDGRVLIGERAAGKAHAGMWEFPGGKVEPGEPTADALVRELAEELGIAADPSGFAPIGFATRALPDRELLLMLFAVHRWTRTPTAVDHAALAWHEVSALTALAMPPADRALLAALRRYVAVPADDQAGRT